MYPYVSSIDGPFYYNNGFEVEKKYDNNFLQVVMVIIYTRKQGLKLVEAITDILP